MIDKTGGDFMNNEEMAKQLFMLVGLMQREPIKKMQKISQG